MLIYELYINIMNMLLVRFKHLIYLELECKYLWQWFQIFIKDRIPRKEVIIVFNLWTEYDYYKNTISNIKHV